MAPSNAFARTGWNALVKQRFINPSVLSYTPVDGTPEVDYTGIWPNCTAYAGEMLMKLGKYITP